MGYKLLRYISLIIVLSYHCVAFSQNSIGIMGGYGKSRFINIFKDDNYKAEYKFGDAYSFSGFYETKTDSFGKLKFELTYAQQNLSLDAYKIITHLAFSSWDLKYKNQFIKFNIIRSFRILDKPMFKMNFLAGLLLKCNVQTSSIEYSTEVYQVAAIDSSGNTYYLPDLRNVEIYDENSKDFKPINLGLETGLELGVPLSSKLDLIFQNRYNMDLSRALRIKGINHTLIIATSLNLGLRYRLK